MPQIGDITAIPLPGDRWVYTYHLDSSFSLLLSTASKGILPDSSAIITEKYVCFLEIWNIWTVNCITVGSSLSCNLSLVPENFFFDGSRPEEPPMYRLYFASGNPTVTKEETKGMHQVFRILSMDQFLLMAEALLPRMEWLEGGPSRTAMTVGPGQLEPETVDFEINGIPPEDVERVEEEVLKALDGLSLDFECTGSSDSGGNVALRGPLSAVTQSAPPDGHLNGFKVRHFRM